jgi:large subunit ribosomal protein L6
MSRIGKKPVAVPSGVKVEVSGRVVKTSGPKGNLSWEHPGEVSVKLDGNEVLVSRPDQTSRSSAMQGLTRSIIANMVNGVEKGYEKKLEIYGTGYGCQVKGNKLLLNVGYMGRGVDAGGKPREAQFVIEIPQGVTVNVEVPAARGDSDPAKISISGPDKQQVGQFAAEIRGIRPPEPYKGKGIRYSDEHVRRKQGKAFASGGG